VACGGGESSTSDVTSTASAAGSAQIEALKLEKEKAEFEAQTAKAEARAEAQSAAKARVAAEQESDRESEPEQEPENELEPVPDVVGLRLPQARSTLSAAGYTTRAENTDTTFGIVVPSHYTVCEQSDPQGTVVTVLAQKYGC
jgi:hypothetical protein